MMLVPLVHFAERVYRLGGFPNAISHSAIKKWVADGCGRYSNRENLKGD
jgi:hypothetical protein